MKKINKFIKKHPYQSFFIGLLIALGFYLRAEPGFFNLSHFSLDQGEDITLAKHLVVDKKISLISRGTGLQGVMMGPLYTWVLSIPFALSGGSPNFNVIFFSVFGILHVIATYLVVKKFSNQSSATVAAFLTLFSPAIISASRIVLSPSPLTFIGIIYLWLIWEIILNKKNIYLPLLALVISCMFHFEIGYALFALPSALITIAIFSGKKPYLSKNFIYSIPAFILPFTPQIFFEFRHNFTMTNAVLNFLNGTNQSLGREPGNIFNKFIYRITDLYTDFVYTTAFKPELPLLVITMLAIIILGWFIIFQTKNDKSLKLGKITASLTILTYLGLVFYPGPVWAWYRAGMPSLFIIIAALPIGELLSVQKLPWKKPAINTHLKLAIIVFLIFLSLFSIQPHTRSLVWNGEYQGDTSTLRNQHLALESIYKDANTQPFALYVYTPPVYPYIWDYNLYWHAQKTYGYLPKPYDILPQPDNPENIYLLIEETDEYTSRAEGWIDNYNHLGEKVATWRIPGKIRIEKWHFEKQPELPNPLIRELSVFETN